MVCMSKVMTQMTEDQRLRDKSHTAVVSNNDSFEHLRHNDRATRAEGRRAGILSPNSHLQASTDDINLVPLQVNFTVSAFHSNILSSLNMNKCASKMLLNHFKCLSTFSKTERGTLRWVDVGRGNIINAWCNELYQTIDEFRCDLINEDEYYICFTVWGRTDGRCTMIKVVEVLIKGIAIQLSGYDFFNGRIRYSKGFLETFQDTLTILMGILHAIRQNRATKEWRYQQIWHPLSHSW